MNQQTQHQGNALVERLGLAAGVMVAFSWIMPLYEMSYEFFTSQVLKYTSFGTEWLWSALWGFCLFFFILAAVQFAVSAIAAMGATFLSMMAVKFTLWRNKRRY